MPFPNTGIVEQQVRLRAAANLKRKTADNDFIARLFAGNNPKLNHKLRGMKM
jgi:hypothetical protein